MREKSRFSSPFKGRTRQLRREQTIAEKHAWHLLRDRRALGVKFRRQVAIGDFIVDFYCDELRLVVEIEGDVPDRASTVQRDKALDRKLRYFGYQVLRFANAIIINDPDVLLEAIRSLRPSPGAPGARRPLPEGEGL